MLGAGDPKMGRASIRKKKLAVLVMEYLDVSSVAREVVEKRLR